MSNIFEERRPVIKSTKIFNTRQLPLPVTNAQYGARNECELAGINYKHNTNIQVSDSKVGFVPAGSPDFGPERAAEFNYLNTNANKLIYLPRNQPISVPAFAPNENVQYSQQYVLHNTYSEPPIMFNIQPTIPAYQLNHSQEYGNPHFQQQMFIPTPPLPQKTTTAYHPAELKEQTVNNLQLEEFQKNYQPLVIKSKNKNKLNKMSNNLNKMNNNLNNHRNVSRKGVSSGGSKSICTVCNKICQSPSALKIHMAIHSEGKPFKCFFCNGFISKFASNRNRHMKQVHQWDNGKGKLEAP